MVTSSEEACRPLSHRSSLCRISQRQQLPSLQDPRGGQEGHGMAVLRADMQSQGPVLRRDPHLV